MCNINKNNNLCCCVFNIITSLIAGAGIAAYFFVGVLTSINALIYITLILGILGLLYVLFSAFGGSKRTCDSLKDSCLATSSVISIVLSSFALSFSSFPAVSIPVAIFIGALTFAFISNLINVIKVIIDKLCGRRCCE